MQADLYGPAARCPSDVGDVVDALVGSHLQELRLGRDGRTDVDLLGDPDLRVTELGEAADDPD
jgi:hypothetical protein